MGERFSEIPGISVVVPIGPHPDYRKYLKECLDSISEQLKPDDQVIIIDDQAHLESKDLNDEDYWVEWDPESVSTAPFVIWETPWLTGCASAWNFGVAMAKHDLCLLMGSDDRLLPGCLDALREAYMQNKGKAAWYNLTIRIDEGPDKGLHDVFNNAAAVTKGLWNLLGGFPPSASLGAPDALLISILMVHMAERLIQVKQGTPLYWCRVHPAQDTPRQAGLFSQEVVTVRDKETRRWGKPTWTSNP